MRSGSRGVWNGHGLFAKTAHVYQAFFSRHMKSRVVQDFDTKTWRNKRDGLGSKASGIRALAQHRMSTALASTTLNPLCEDIERTPEVKDHDRVYVAAGVRISASCHAFIVSRFSARRWRYNNALPSLARPTSRC